MYIPAVHKSCTCTVLLWKDSFLKRKRGETTRKKEDCLFFHFMSRNALWSSTAAVSDSKCSNYISKTMLPAHGPLKWYSFADKKGCIQQSLCGAIVVYNAFIWYLLHVAFK